MPNHLENCNNTNTNDIFNTETMHEFQFMRSATQFLAGTINEIETTWEENDAIINCYNQIFKVVEDFETGMKHRSLESLKL